jgi:hypothetical protein
MCKAYRGYSNLNEWLLISPTDMEVPIMKMRMPIASLVISNLSNFVRLAVMNIQSEESISFQTVVIFE